MNRRIIKNKKINPKIYIFCEGESEDAYIQFLKIKYRLPIQVITKITKNKISTKLIKTNLKSYEKHEKDRIFLMYDIDVQGFLEKLLIIKNQIAIDLILSNPCMELWFLLHQKNQTAEINSENCLKQLITYFPDYKKGIICNKLQNKLKEKLKEAKNRAVKLEILKNPSSNIYQLIDLFEEIISDKIQNNEQL